MIQGLPITLNNSSFSKKKSKSILELVGLLLACMVLACSFYTILIYYYVSTTQSSNIQTFPCNGSAVSDEVTLCSLHGIGAVTSADSGCNEGDCSIVYTGSICTDVLRAWQTCAFGQSQQHLYIQTGLYQNELESELEDYLDDISNKNCQQALLNFLCLYTYPLCDCSTQKTYMPIRNTCVEIIQNTTCMQENQQPSNSSISINCNQLPTQGVSSFSCVSSNTTSLMNVTCQSSFTAYNNTCWPTCGEWTQDDDDVSIFLISAKLLFTSAGYIIVLISLLLLVCEWKRLLKFPNYLAILVAIDYLLIASLVIVSSQVSFLFCNQDRLDISQDKSTPYCTATGVAFYYLHSQMIIFWFMHVSFLFYTMTFPSHAKEHREDPTAKATSTLCVIIGLCLPGIAPFIILALRQTTYRQYSYPASFCFMKSFPLQFYTLVVPGTVLLSIGSVLGLITLWIIHKRQGLFITKKQLHVKFEHTQVTGKEKQIFLFFISVLAYSTLIMIYTTHLGVNHNQLYIEMEGYFNCEKNGCNSNSNITQYTSGYVELAVYIILITIPLTILLYMVEIKHLHQVICRLKVKNHNRDIYNTTGGSHKRKARPSTHKSISRQYILSPFEMDVTQTIPEEDEDEL